MFYFCYCIMVPSILHRMKCVFFWLKVLTCLKKNKKKKTLKAGEWAEEWLLFVFIVAFITDKSITGCICFKLVHYRFQSVKPSSWFLFVLKSTVPAGFMLSHVGFYCIGSYRHKPLLVFVAAGHCECTLQDFKPQFPSLHV